MKLSDTTTIKLIREFIGQKIMTRTSRTPIKIVGIEITEDEAWFIGYEGTRKRKIKPQYISEMWALDEPEEKTSTKRARTPQEIKEARLRKAEEAEAKKKEKKQIDFGGLLDHTHPKDIPDYPPSNSGTSW